MTPSGAPARSAVASAPGRVPLAGSGDGPWLSVALDRRAVCRVEPLAAGVEVESKEALTKTAVRDVAELVARAPGSLAGQVLQRLGATSGLRVVTEWKLPAASGVDADAALALATATAVAQALGRPEPPEELLGLAREAASRAGRDCGHGLHAALWGGVVVTDERDGALRAERPAVDPGRVEEALMLVDVPPAEDAAGAGQVSLRGPGGPSEAGGILEALAGGRFEEAVEQLLAEPGRAAGSAQQGVVEAVRAAGGAARALQGRLVLVWAPPGARGPGRREAVEAALRSGGWKPLPLRVDLRGLEVD